MFEGISTAIITPFRDGKIDESALRKLIERQIDAGVDALVPCGSTGESATMSHEEHARVVEITVSAVSGRVAVLAGTGSNNTREAGSTAVSTSTRATAGATASANAVSRAHDPADPSEACTNTAPAADAGKARSQLCTCSNPMTAWPARRARPNKSTQRRANSASTVAANA